MNTWQPYLNKTQEYKKRGYIIFFFFFKRNRESVTG